MQRVENVHGRAGPCHPARHEVRAQHALHAACAGTCIHSPPPAKSAIQDRFTSVRRVGCMHVRARAQTQKNIRMCTYAHTCLTDDIARTRPTAAINKADVHHDKTGVYHTPHCSVHLARSYTLNPRCKGLDFKAASASTLAHARDVLRISRTRTRSHRSTRSQTHRNRKHTL